MKKGFEKNLPQIGAGQTKKQSCIFCARIKKRTMMKGEQTGQANKSVVKRKKKKKNDKTGQIYVFVALQYTCFSSEVVCSIFHRSRESGKKGKGSQCSRESRDGSSKKNVVKINCRARARRSGSSGSFSVLVRAAKWDLNS